MRTIILTIIILSALNALLVISAFAHNPKCKNYPCNKIGVQKIKPFKHKKIKPVIKQESDVKLNIIYTPKFRA